MITHSQAAVLSAYFIAEGILTNPSLKKEWPVYANTMPDQPQEVAVVYNTNGMMDGREHNTGRSVIHPGFSILLRTPTNDRADAKYGEISQSLDEIRRTLIVVGGKSYILHAMKRTSPMIPIGERRGGGRLKFSISGNLTYGEA